MAIPSVVSTSAEDERYFPTRGRRVREFASSLDATRRREWIGRGENRDCIVDDVDIKR
jgi:hypothetical protein|tara:strand:- start:1621 stop:1794 length:174 start_codon:yes stop_codon:yes gene_type:complete